MTIRVLAVAMVLGAGAPALAAPACLPGQACVVAVKADAARPARRAHAAPPRSYGREIALLAGLGVLGLMTRRRRPLQEVVA